MQVPRNFKQLAELIAKSQDALSPQLESAARYVLDHPENVALWSMRELAQAARLPAVTLVRLARALGFPGYAELRAVFQKGFREGWGSRRYSSRARELQVRDHDSGTNALVGTLFDSEVDNLRRTFEYNEAGRLAAALDLLERARRLGVLGQRSCFPSSYFFHYVYSLFRDNSMLLQGYGGTVADELRVLTADDVLLVISIAPYAADVVHAVQYAKSRGTRIVAISDGSLSPVAREADRVLMTSADTPSFFRSMVSTQALVQTLLALLVARGGGEALAAIENSEAQLAHFNIYWNGARRHKKRIRAAQCKASSVFSTAVSFRRRASPAATRAAGRDTE